ncbi:fatty acid synthase alpha subunit Lsd1 [Coemansia sp. RSA 2618]|nr:fatty acid synthase alpha subunit Lsd1 [Coemansia sp. RSA 2618]
MYQCNGNAHSVVVTVAGLQLGADVAAKAQLLYSAFELNAKSTDATSNNAPDDSAADSIIETLKFLEYAWVRDAPVAATVFKEFEAQYCADHNIHVVVGNMDITDEQAQEVLRLYYELHHKYTQTHRRALPSAQTKSALLATPEFRPLAVFGGQGGMDNYMDETRSVFTVYRPLIEEYVQSMAEFLVEATDAPKFASLYQHGFDLMSWIKAPETTPKQSYMVSVPVCLPIVGLTQLMQVMVLYKTLGISPSELADGFHWITGHSQGIVSAVVLSMATDEDSFYRVSKTALGLLILTGAFPQLDYPLIEPQPTGISESAAPTPMAAVLKLTRTQLESAILRFNKRQTEGKVYLSLANSVQMHVVSGAIPSMRKFVDMLTTDFDTENKDQTRVPYSQRKVRVLVKYLSINGPYHCPLLKHAYEGACQYATERNWTLDGHSLRRPVKTYEDGRDIHGVPELSHYLLKCMMVFPVDWPAAVECPEITHVVDFGPGGTSGFGTIVHRIYEGRGVATVCAGAFVSYSSPLRAKADLYQADASAVVPPKSWAAEYAPWLVKHTDSLHIETPMSRLLGRPPVMVAGMTPSTVGAEFVSAVINAGYHIELSGGGHFSEPMLRDKADAILKLVDPGSSITVNSIYINPFLWNIQYPALLAMRREGIPLDGLCIGAGVPSFDVCNDIVACIRDAGFRHIGLKPSSVATIRLVIKIAHANRGFPILLQWTGGRAGGHHSFEDFHQPILETYGAIRAQKNIVLVAGSGFGGVDDTLPYLTGDWSTKFDCAPMPFDGILLGSRVMVAKEGGASDAVKEAIVAAPGIDDSEWEKTYQGPAGGIVTVLSEMGEPIHKIANRGVMLWKELDDSVFSLPRDKRLPALLAKKDYIIRRLNDDFQKPWFGKKADGTTVDLEEMTYAEVANRLVEVLYVKHQSRWIDVTMRNLVGDYLLRLEERFAGREGPALLQSFTQINDPFAQIASLLDAYPESRTQLLASEDVQFFINLCLRPGQKPVPFIPLMDKDFHIWFKKDSLWQAEDVDAVAGQDVGRVCILQGPVAVRYSTKANEPVKDILDTIYHGQIAALLERYYQGDEANVPRVGYLSNASETPAVPAHVRVETRKTERMYTLPERASQLPETEAWLETLAGGELSWLRALLTTPVVVQDRTYTGNMVKRVLRPRVGQVVKVKVQNGLPQALEVIDASGTTALDISIDADNLIRVNMFSAPRGPVCTLELLFRYQAAMPYAPIHEVMEGRNERIKRFYAQVWFENSSEATSIIAQPTNNHAYMGSVISADAYEIEAFCRAIGNTSSQYITSYDSAVPAIAPMDYAMRMFWPALCKCLMSPACDGDLTSLVHVSNEFRIVERASPIRVGEQLSSEARVTEVVDGSTGRSVRVQGHVMRGDRPVVSIDTSFLYRGQKPDYAVNFRNVDEPTIELKIADAATLALLRGKEWLVMLPQMDKHACVGTTLQLRLLSQYRMRTATVYSYIATFGKVLARASGSSEWIKVADVDFECANAFDNPVLRFLHAHGRVMDSVRQLAGDGRELAGTIRDMTSCSPASNYMYANVSTDHNPIHTSVYFADLVGLPGTITHGMWTSAAARRTIERVVACGHPERVSAYRAQFVDMVMPGTALEMQLQHTGFVDGRLKVRVQAFANGTRVLEGSAEVEQPRTAFAFTGQGAHSRGMGMALYDTSAAARRVWDAADEFMRNQYGIPLLHIVRENPPQLTVHFIGARGERVRSAFRAMQFEDTTHHMCAYPRQMFPDIYEDTMSHTFSAPRGLLFATEFTQPAMLVCAAAEFAHLREAGVVPENAVFAGHSLGEFAGLCAVAQVLTPATAADIGFCRGLTMQRCVDRDAQGRSAYAMLAVSPARVASWFTPDDLESAIIAIKQHSGPDELLEIVNHNVRFTQYVVAGELLLLTALNIMLESLAKQPEMPTKSLPKYARSSVAHARELLRCGTLIELERTRATIPVPGIDVPFHSSLLRAGTHAFRKLLLGKIKHVAVDRLHGRYIPNLTAQPFAVTRAYVKLVLQLTQSEPLELLLGSWDDKRVRCDPQYEQQVARVLLIEVLAFQFASPVRWIETQDVMIEELNIGRFVEIGPGNVLANMFSQTIGSSAYAQRGLAESISVQCSATDMDALVYKDDIVSTSVDSSEAKTTQVAEESQPVEKPPSVNEALSVEESQPCVEIPDAPIQPLEVIRALVAYKLKLKLDQVTETTTIKDLVGGKSTLQNEITGDLQKEFSGDMPDKPEEQLLGELAQSLTPIDAGLGKVTTTLVSRMLSSKMPGGLTKSAVCKHIHNTFGLGSQRQHALLLVALTMEPAARLDSDDSAKRWLATVAQAYAKTAGISLVTTRANSSSSSTATRAAVVINSDEFNQAQKAQRQLATRNMNALAAYLGVSADPQPKSPHTDATDAASSDVWAAEYGQEFCDGIRPMFASPKARRYNSYWNWVRQDVMQLHYDILGGRVTKIDLAMSSHCLRLMNRVTPALIDVLNHIVWSAAQGSSPGHTLAKRHGAGLVKQCELGLHAQPVYQFTAQLRAPRLRIGNGGEVEYFEVDRAGEATVHDYVRAVCCTDATHVALADPLAGSSLDVILQKLGLLPPESQRSEPPRKPLPPMVHLRTRIADPTTWNYDSDASAEFAGVMRSICDHGLALSGRRALVTGCGRGSIGAEVLKGLLEAGAHVVATTSSYSAATTRYFQDVYQTHGSRGSSLTVVPFNQASRQDVTTLIEYIYSEKGLCWDLDFVLPFAAIPELGHDVTELGARSELAHRAMLTNVMRLLGEIATHKQRRTGGTHVTLAVLPLSPNHGTFGYDGHYSESKLGLETLLSRWYAEPTWGEFVAVAGASIGWTRGTALMSGNNIVAELVERSGVRTFSAAEMAFNVLALLHPRMHARAARAPVWADMAGRFQHYPRITKSVITMHGALARAHDILKAASADSLADFGLVADDEVERVYTLNTLGVRANHKFRFPEISSYEKLAPLRHLQGMINLDRVVVVTGYGEVGPYGNAETRWEMEAFGEFSLEGCIELAWIMGLIKHFNGRLPSKQQYTGWIDAASGEPVPDRYIKQRYEKHILEHTGIRLIEPELIGGYDPREKPMLRELQIEHDMEPFEATADEAAQFKLRNGDKVSVWEDADSTWFVRFRKGATLLVPKALRVDRLVAAQLPTGWNPERFGIPASIGEQVDPITSYALVATVEALVRSGITDPYELYAYVHMSEVGSATGTALGGLRSLQRVFAERQHDVDQAPDVYQETFSSTPPAWINMLLVSASGPIKTTIGACATGVASIDVAVDTIQSGKAKVMLAGGTDALCAESSFEFAQMRATSSSVDEEELGREPREMSRPCTESRNGFMESEGAGIVTLMSATTAIEMGVPIYGIVAMTGTATDKEGRSVPAPGKGVLTSAREVGATKRVRAPVCGVAPSQAAQMSKCGTAPESPAHMQILDIEYRRRQLQLRQQQIDEWATQERALATHLDCEHRAFIDSEAARQHREAQDAWGNDFWKRNPRISPLRGSLAVWGLTVDDIGVASFHGTSTKANDLNESEIVERQLKHLGRTRGNVVFAVCQKYLTGHPKGPAAMWMLNGVMQILRTGIVPGNRNADNIAPELEKFEHIVYPSRSIRTPGIKAALLKSFGFGQVGAECLMVHPDYLFAVLGEQQLAEYAQKAAKREARAYRYWHDVLTGAHPFVQIKDEPPYTADEEEAMYLDPLCRIAPKPTH